MSQLGAPEWVLTTPHGDKPGFFLEVGCADAELISNTHLLEKNGWRGIAIDPLPRTVVERALVAGEAGREVQFAICHTNPDLSGIVDALGCHRDNVLGGDHEVVTLSTQTLGDILKKHDAPGFIEYMSLDVEGSEYEVLRAFPFDEYAFGCISVEHNYELDKKELVHDLLTANGYALYKDVEWDSWYVRS
jgi:hypothetical protein